jgi:hypothetical protein
MLNQSLFCSILFGLLIGIVACDSQTSVPSIDLKEQQSSAAFVNEIPVYKSGRRQGQLDGYYKYLKEDAYALKIDSLELGFDSLQLRIWLGHDLAIKRNLVIIKAYQGKWHAELLTFWMENDESGKWHVARKENKAIVPQSGWKRFLDTLSELKILTLPNSGDIPGYDGCGATDGINYFFEIATVNRYRFYYYCNPDYSLPRFWQAYNVWTFATFLEKEFNFEYTK